MIENEKKQEEQIKEEGQCCCSENTKEIMDEQIEEVENEIDQLSLLLNIDEKLEAMWEAQQYFSQVLPIITNMYSLIAHMAIKLGVAEKVVGEDGKEGLNIIEEKKSKIVTLK